nr:protein NRT1/ PTR FAMILY 4.5-like [Ipomoea trifida]
MRILRCTGTFAFENMATIVLGLTFLTYFNGVMHFNLADAANHVTNFLGTNYILTVLIAVLADTYTGRFLAVLISAWIEFLGLGLLAFQAHHRKLKPPACIPNPSDPSVQCEEVSGRNAAILFLAVYLTALGSAGVKSAVPSHGADQFDEKEPKEAAQMSSFFNWLLLGLCVGAAASLTLIVWIIQDKGWDKGFGVCTLAMFLGGITFSAGLPFYRIYVIQGSSAITRVVQVYVAAMRNRNLQLPADSSVLYEISKDREAANETDFLPHTDKYRFLDRAAIQTSPEQSQNPNPWNLCTVTQVENAKILLSMIPVFLCTPLPISVFWLSIQYFIFGIADMFTYVGLLEFFYSQAPRELKSVSSCFLWSSMSLGNHLDLFYALLSAMSFVNFLVYLVVATRYKYRQQKVQPADDEGDGEMQ